MTNITVAIAVKPYTKPPEALPDNARITEDEQPRHTEAGELRTTESEE